jgi:hypothetical protein
VRGIHTREESMCRQLAGECVHREAPARAQSVDRIAAASSVMSMPTGHQAMQRPHPTQPDVPNCSHQVPSLWVIHCRYRLRVV